jgi:RIO-like serine/threonine protein kinase
MEKNVSKIGQYTIGNKLGEGLTSIVKEAKDPQGNVFAMKIFDK